MRALFLLFYLALLADVLLELVGLLSIDMF